MRLLIQGHRNSGKTTLTTAYAQKYLNYVIAPENGGFGHSLFRLVEAYETLKKPIYLDKLAAYATAYIPFMKNSIDEWSNYSDILFDRSILDQYVSFSILKQSTLEEIQPIANFLEENLLQLLKDLLITIDGVFLLDTIQPSPRNQLFINDIYAILSELDYSSVYLLPSVSIESRISIMNQSIETIEKTKILSPTN